MQAKMTPICTVSKGRLYGIESNAGVKFTFLSRCFRNGNIGLLGAAIYSGVAAKHRYH